MTSHPAASPAETPGNASATRCNAKALWRNRSTFSTVDACKCTPWGRFANQIKSKHTAASA
eukprot:1559264-Lingulodinium_polyedra.AAC.1